MVELVKISIHALREEGDKTPIAIAAAIANFYPRPPRGGRPEHPVAAGVIPCISIHALREEGDFFLSTFPLDNSLFLSTPSARRATRCQFAGHVRCFISIHALREEGDVWTATLRRSFTKFLSTPSARRATSLLCHKHSRSAFLSTPSARRATLLRLSFADCGTISIHALREEGDEFIDFILEALSNFYPRPPRGGRHASIISATISFNFYPRPPRGGRLFSHRLALLLRVISIHALREEGDSFAPITVPIIADFYPRPPRGGRQQKQRQNLYFQTNYTTFCTNLEEP